MRQEGKEIIQNLAKAAGLATMIAAMRPDIDNIDRVSHYTRQSSSGLCNPFCPPCSRGRCSSTCIAVQVLLEGAMGLYVCLRRSVTCLCRYVRNTTARAFSVVAQALGIPLLLLPFLKAVCLSKKSWQARGTQAPRLSSRMILLRQ